jgi:hypothetical protein
MFDDDPKYQELKRIREQLALRKAEEEEYLDGLEGG